MLDDYEIEYWRKRHGKGVIDADALIQRAQDEAQAYVDAFAEGYLASVQAGIYRAIFLHTLESDPGERKNFMGTVQCLRELGEQINANSVKP